VDSFEQWVADDPSTFGGRAYKPFFYGGAVKISKNGERSIFIAIVTVPYNV